MKITINQKNLAKFNIFVLFYYIVTNTMCYAFNFNKILLYLGEIFNIILFILILKYSRNKKTYGRLSITLLILYTILGLFSNLVNFENVFLVFWGLKNIIHYILFFYSCSNILKREDMQKVMTIFQYMFFLSFPLSIYQHFFVKYPTGTIIGDQVGGIFFTYPGCNVPLHTLILVYVTYQIINYFQGKENIKKFLIVTIIGIAMAIMAELKIFILEYILLIIYAFFSSRVSIKTLIGIIVLTAILFLSISYFVKFNDNGATYSDNFTINGMVNIMTRDSGYDGVGDLNRLTGIKVINDNNEMFINKYFNRLFGIGLGNAEYSNLYNSNYYIENNKTHYQWFQAIWTYIETGYIGLIIYISVFISIIINSNKIKQIEIKKYVKILAIISVGLIFYNNTLRIDASAFIMYFILSSVYYIRKEEIENEENT